MKSNCDISNKEENNKITLEDGLSAETYAILLKYMQSNDINNTTSVDQDNVDPIRLNLSDIQSSDLTNSLENFKTHGVIRLNNILPKELCDKCLISINDSLHQATELGIDYYSLDKEMGFGNVDSSDLRWDMYLNYEGIYKEAMMHLFGDQNSILNQTFKLLFNLNDNLNDVEIHEFAALISDSGAISQRIHSDTTYQDNCPLYTVFISLQDINTELGPTIYLPGTHTAEAHHSLRHNRIPYLNSLHNKDFRHALLNTGDLTIMDSRILHCGDSNGIGRRVLFYFTLLHPNFIDMGGGSKFPTMKLFIKDIINEYNLDKYK